jgi:hypothetical protein
MSQTEKSNALTTRAPDPSPAMMLAAIIEKGVTPENVNVLEAMVGLYERMEAKSAEKAFNVAFTDLQKKLPEINATKAVPNDDGTVRYMFAPLEEIDAKLRPIALKHGFTYSFGEGASDDMRVVKLCTVAHVAGHSRTNSFACRRSGPPKTSVTQADGSTHSYAKRGALCDAFGIIVKGQDDDARLLGDKISKAEAQDLESRVTLYGVNKDTFLQYAGAVDFESITRNRYDDLDKQLKKAEKKVKQEAAKEQARAEAAKHQPNEGRLL